MNGYFELKDRIRVLRTGKKITQKELADFLGVAIQTVNKYENGRAIPDAVTLNLIVEHLDCNDPGWLLTGNRSGGVAFTPDVCPVVGCTEEMKQLFSRIISVYEADKVFAGAIESNLSMIEEIIALKKKLPK